MMDCMHEPVDIFLDFRNSCFVSAFTDIYNKEQNNLAITIIIGGFVSCITA